MQGDGREPRARRAHRVHQPVGEMQSRGRRGHRAFTRRINRLVVLVIRGGRPAVARDIGRQRHFAVAFQRVEQRLPAGKGQQDLSRLSLFVDAGTESVGEIDDVAGAELAGRPRERPPAAVGLRLVQRHLYLRAAPRAAQARGDDPRVVDDQHVLGPQQTRQVRNRAIGQHVRNFQHSGRIPRPGGRCRDTVGRQVKIEIVGREVPGDGRGGNGQDDSHKSSTFASTRANASSFSSTGCGAACSSRVRFSPHSYTYSRSSSSVRMNLRISF